MKFPETKISQIAKFINGFAFRPNDWGSEGRPIIRIQNLNDPLKPYNLTNRKVPKKYLVTKGDILIAWSASIGVFEWDGEEALLNQHIFKVEFDHKKVEKSFFKIALEKTIEDLIRFAHGSTMKHIVKKDFENHRIPLPPLNNQTRIATLLSKVESLMAKRKKSITDLDELVKSTFLEMFGDFATKENWFIEKLGEISKIQGGLQVTSKRKVNPIERPYLRVANVYRDSLVLDIIKTIKATEAEAKRVQLKKGDILVVEGHGNPNEIGRSAVWDGSIEGCLHQNHLIRVRVNKMKLLPIFCSYYINSSTGRQQMFRAGKTTSGLNTISSKNVKDTLIPVPPLKPQNQFAAIVKKVESIKEKYKNSLNDLETLYAALSQKAFKGELDLSQIPLVHALEAKDIITGAPQLGKPSLTVQEDLKKEPVSREQTMHQLFQSYVSDLKNDCFSLDDFWAKAEENFMETMDEEDPPLGMKEYDQVKAWLFELLASGKILQVFNNDENRMQLHIDS